ncbi:MAG: DMT family transporter [Actinomycetes bacterium]
MTQVGAPRGGARGAESALIAATVAAFAWGVGPLAVRGIDAPAALTAFWRLWIAVPIAWLLARSSGGLDLRTLRRAIVPGVLFALSLMTGWTSIRTTSVANATIIPALQPVLVLLVASRMFGERIRRRDLVLGGCGLAGVLTFIAVSSDTSGASRRGDLWAVAGLIVWVAYFIETKRLRTRHEDVHTLPLLAGVMLIGAITMTPYTVVLEGVPKALGTVDWFLVLFIVIVPGFTGHGLMTWAQRHAPVTLLSVVMLLSPVVSAVGAWILFGQTLLPMQFVAGAVVLGSVAGVVTGHRGVPVEPEVA